jgi:hypothetical protein
MAWIRFFNNTFLSVGWGQFSAITLFTRRDPYLG